jgi:hypothetical protein
MAGEPSHPEEKQVPYGAGMASQTFLFSTGGVYCIFKKIRNLKKSLPVKFTN